MRLTISFSTRLAARIAPSTTSPTYVYGLRRDPSPQIASFSLALPLATKSAIRFVPAPGPYADPIRRIAYRIAWRFPIDWTSDSEYSLLAPKPSSSEHFHQKCLERMVELRRRGTTIILVSHNMQTIEQMCDRACLLVRGRLEAEGEPGKVIPRYREALSVGTAPV
jgi:hypothetical protein